jgi:pseudaminic acid synthase
MNSVITISGRKIGPGNPTYIIAEMSANHGQDFNKAVRLIQAAKEAGADAIKLQTYRPDTITIDSRRPEFLIGKNSLWEGKNLYELYGEAFTPWVWQPKLKTVAENLGLHCFSTPFDNTAVDFLESMDVPAYKIASFEMVDEGLLLKVCSTGKPIIMSTGMATLGEIDEAVRTLRRYGCNQLALLKCNSSYPARADEMNLRTIPHMAEAFGLPVGISDHTIGTACAVTAAALGACIIEKHFTLSRADGGPDAAFSLEPSEFKILVDAVRVAEKALGCVNYDVTASEAASRTFRRSLYVVKNMTQGQLYSHENVRSIRPAHGLAPKYLPTVIGRVATRTIVAGTPLDWGLVGPGPSALA